MSLQNAPNPTTSSFPITSPSRTAGGQERSGFVDRRGNSNPLAGQSERRQFGSSHAELSDEGRELALAIDRYKVENHRRYLTCDEMLALMRQLGYAKSVTPADAT